MNVGKEILQNIQDRIPTSLDCYITTYHTKLSLLVLKELMLWHNPEFHNYNIAHAIARYGVGIKLLDLFIECKEFSLKNEMLAYFLQSLDDKGNTCFHLAASEDNLAFLERVLHTKVLGFIRYSLVSLLHL